MDRPGGGGATQVAAPMTGSGSVGQSEATRAVNIDLKRAAVKLLLHGQESGTTLPPAGSLVNFIQLRDDGRGFHFGSQLTNKLRLLFSSATSLLKMTWTRMREETHNGTQSQTTRTECCGCSKWPRLSLCNTDISDMT